MEPGEMMNGMYMYVLKAKLIIRKLTCREDFQTRSSPQDIEIQTGLQLELKVNFQCNAHVLSACAGSIPFATLQATLLCKCLHICSVSNSEALEI